MPRRAYRLQPYPEPTLNVEGESIAAVIAGFGADEEAGAAVGAVVQVDAGEASQGVIAADIETLSLSAKVASAPTRNVV